MKIAVISRAWFTEVRGGAERYIYEVAKELISRGYVVTSFSQNHSDLHNRHIKIHVFRIPIISSALSSLFFGIFTELGNFDVVLVNGYWAEFSPLFLTKPWILILHDITFFRSKRVQKNKIKHVLRKVFLSQVAKRALKIIVPSYSTYYDAIKFLNVDKEKLKIVPEGIDINKFKKGSHNSDGIFRILQVGRFDPNKGQDILIKSFKILQTKYSNLKLYLVGSTSKMYIKYFNYLLNISLGEKNIIFKTDVDDIELLNYLHQADLCVFPSRGEEGWGLAVAEAFACRVPVICSKIFFETGVADESRALLAPTDPEKLAERIHWAIENREFMEKLASNGYEYVQNLSWKKTTDRIMEIVKDLIKVWPKSKV